jgi:DNA polymerase-3 subunit delta'
MFAVGLAGLLVCPQAVEDRLVGQRAELVGIEELRRGCGRCEDCRWVAAGTHPDLHLIYRQLNREHPDADVRKRKALDLGVDVLRHFVIERVGLTPIRGRCKLFIIREADRMNPHAQNALLKTLEEPPGHTIIILLATAPDLLLPTTLSRCQRVRFDPLPTAFVQERLRSRYPDLSAEQAAWYARIGEGSIGRAGQAVEDEWYERSRRLGARLAELASSRPSDLVQCWIEESKSLGQQYAERDEDITDTEATRRALKALLQLTAAWYDETLRRMTGLATDADSGSSAHGLGGGWECDRPIAAIDRIAEAEGQLDLNVNTQLCLEALVNDLAASARGDAVAA